MATETQEPGTIELPATEQYRVVGVGATFNRPVEIIGPDGKPTVVYTFAFGSRGQVVDLVAGEARRLQALGAVKPVDEAKSYDEMGDDELAAEARQRGITVRSSGADSEQPLRTDYIGALQTFDLGSDQGLVGVSSAPGQVVQVSSDGHALVTVDGENPPEHAGEEGNPGSFPAERAGFVDKATRDGGDGATAASSDYSAKGKSATAVAKWIESERPNEDATVAAAQDDPDLARRVLEAESAATQGDPRQGVKSRLERIAEGGGQ
jgi:hypothetical protein